MIKTREDIEEVRAIASQLAKRGVPQKIVDKIFTWAKDEAKRLRDEAREHSH